MANADNRELNEAGTTFQTPQNLNKIRLEKVYKSTAIERDTSVNSANTNLQNANTQVDEYLNFMQQNPKIGALKVQANTAQQTIPVDNALVEVSKNFNGIRRVFYSLRTDQSGIIDDILLPAPDKALSQEPSNKKPFSNYDVHVEHPGFNSEDYAGVLIFDGVKSIQQINLIPLR